METEKEKKGGGVVQAIKDVAGEALQTAAIAAAGVVVSRAIEGAAGLAEKGRTQKQDAPHRGMKAAVKKSASKRKATAKKKVKKAVKKKSAKKRSKKKRI